MTGHIVAGHIVAGHIVARHIAAGLGAARCRRVAAR